jgi:hypothetical protein
MLPPEAGCVLKKHNFVKHDWQYLRELRMQRTARGVLENRRPLAALAQSLQANPGLTCGQPLRPSRWALESRQ